MKQKSSFQHHTPPENAPQERPTHHHARPETPPSGKAGKIFHHYRDSGEICQTSTPFAPSHPRTLAPSHPASRIPASLHPASRIPLPAFRTQKKPPVRCRNGRFGETAVSAGVLRCDQNRSLTARFPATPSLWPAYPCTFASIFQALSAVGLKVTPISATPVSPLRLLSSSE